MGILPQEARSRLQTSGFEPTTFRPGVIGVGLAQDESSCLLDVASLNPSSSKLLRVLMCP
jgi:hypothetical protein